MEELKAKECGCWWERENPRFPTNGIAFPEFVRQRITIQSHVFDESLESIMDTDQVYTKIKYGFPLTLKEILKFVHYERKELASVKVNFFENIAYPSDTTDVENSWVDQHEDIVDESQESISEAYDDEISESESNYSSLTTFLDQMSLSDISSVDYEDPSERISPRSIESSES